ncbi:hypothetical protein G6N74_04865 [Mesorhizobium sp. CGMCC 1.15528]|uniref:Uncharacterized protein n=1 Tax=Mesorhizobium zhangyense TaxID=1776730 RepID=A0A7C9V9S2_9HYPH|nr:hypothetical protein [Mesorhizobium zhangyense]NGN40387.1 hypothetical protein [Mesorhizobium zhangyense]
MTNYLVKHLGCTGIYSPQDLSTLDAVLQSAKQHLQLTDQSDISDLAYKVLTLFEVGIKSPEQILKSVISIDPFKAR